MNSNFYYSLSELFKLEFILFLISIFSSLYIFTIYSIVSPEVIKWTIIRR